MATQCPNKQVMVLQANGEIVTDCQDSDTDDMPPSEDVFEEEHLAPDALSLQKELMKYSGRTSFTLGAMLKTRYVV
jgi:hypothetical protein